MTTRTITASQRYDPYQFFFFYYNNNPVGVEANESKKKKILEGMQEQSALSIQRGTTATNKCSKYTGHRER